MPGGASYSRVPTGYGKPALAGLLSYKPPESNPGPLKTVLDIDAFRIKVSFKKCTPEPN